MDEVPAVFFCFSEIRIIVKIACEQGVIIIRLECSLCRHAVETKPAQTREPRCAVATNRSRMMCHGHGPLARERGNVHVQEVGQVSYRADVLYSRHALDPSRNVLSQQIPAPLQLRLLVLLL
eukprot:4001545-Pyramimonas_sp.AAC.1